MRPSVFLASALAALVAADSSSTTVGIVYPDWTILIPRYESTAASVAGINALATTYQIKCMDGADKLDCDIKTPWTIIQGPATASFTGVYTADASGKDGITVTREWKCDLKSYTESASCTVSYSASGTVDGTEYSTSTTTSNKNMPTDQLTTAGILVTGGIASFTASQATQTPSGAAAGPFKAMVTAAPLGAAAAIAIAGML
ncbi:uncharacterized protein N7496_005125 [Penicillium cataractarum]|uniref:Ig-like domain-containing protein n=1 Tax=Penicillium cataractarum TaxID=2100454 RepID=A0A9W9SFM4_9EURO|nr:uncharacterized protein N7496_005125 [Penicillium cataractarum]KAJ5377716.1 hypothetical protein N7496_005125 [Penicillium cataractarum]